MEEERYNELIASYLSQFEQIFEGEPWYGDSFKTKLKDISQDQAFCQPDQLHSIAQIVWHCIYWHFPLIKRLEGDATYKNGMNDPKNWLSNDALKDKGWEDLKAELFQTKNEITGLLSKTSEEFLKHEYSPGKTVQSLVEGIIHHDVYHVGQIGILKRIIEQ